MLDAFKSLFLKLKNKIRDLISYTNRPSVSLASRVNVTNILLREFYMYITTENPELRNIKHSSQTKINPKSVFVHMLISCYRCHPPMQCNAVVVVAAAALLLLCVFFSLLLFSCCCCCVII